MGVPVSHASGKAKWFATCKAVNFGPYIRAEIKIP